MKGEIYMFKHPKAICRNKLFFLALFIFALCFSGVLPALAGGLIAYEIGTQDVGLASAGYNVRAQDAATVFTNPAGMTRLDGTQILAAGQLDFSNLKFSPGAGTSPQSPQWTPSVITTPFAFVIDHSALYRLKYATSAVPSPS